MILIPPKYAERIKENPHDSHPYAVWADRDRTFLLGHFKTISEALQMLDSFDSRRFGTVQKKTLVDGFNKQEDEKFL